jgi:hypothetical protein
MPKRSRRPLEGLPAPEAFRLIKETVRLERELGRPICGVPVWGEPCTFPKDHPDRLHSGDFSHGGVDQG